MKRLPAVLLLLLLPSCISNYDVAADRATYEAIAPDYLRYVDADPSLSVTDKQRRHTTVETWDMRLKEKEGGK